jgi:hypothetical protein
MDDRCAQFLSIDSDLPNALEAMRESELYMEAIELLNDDVFAFAKKGEAIVGRAERFVVTIYRGRYGGEPSICAKLTY